MTASSPRSAPSRREDGVAPESGEGLGSGDAGKNRVETSGGKTGEVGMRFGKYVCPTRHVNDFTPLEFQEVTRRLLLGCSKGCGNVQCSVCVVGHP